MHDRVGDCPDRRIPKINVVNRDRPVDQPNRDIWTAAGALHQRWEPDKLQRIQLQSPPLHADHSASSPTRQNEEQRKTGSIRRKRSRTSVRRLEASRAENEES